MTMLYRAALRDQSLDMHSNMNNIMIVNEDALDAGYSRRRPSGVQSFANLDDRRTRLIESARCESKGEFNVAVGRIVDGDVTLCRGCLAHQRTIARLRSTVTEIEAFIHSEALEGEF